MNQRVKFLWIIIACGLGAGTIIFLRQHQQSPGALSSIPTLPSTTKAVNFGNGEPFMHATNASTPEATLAIGEKLLADDPTDSDQRASNLLLALCDAKKFPLAVQFANEAPEDLRDSWIKLIFSRWAQSDPQAAMASLNSVSDASARTIAFQSTADSWAANSPSTLADFVTAAPAGDNKTYAVGKLVDNWSLQDPAAFAAWLNTAPSGVDLDKAIATMLSKADTANYPPTTAIKWVENISDSTLKWSAFRRVIAQWNEVDPAAAQQYITTASWLDDDQRQQAQVILQSPASIAADDNTD